MPPETAFGFEQAIGFGKAANETGFSTWKEITQFAEKEGIVKVVSNGQEEWIVMPKPPSPRIALVTEGLGEVEGGVPVQSPDGWYDRKGNEPFPTMSERALIRVCSRRNHLIALLKNAPDYNRYIRLRAPDSNYR